MNSADNPNKFVVRRLPDNADATLISELHRVGDMVSPRALTREAFVKLGGRGAKAIRNRYGNWQSALTAADLSHLYSNAVPSSGGAASRRMTDDEILEQLRNYAIASGVTEIGVSQLRGSQLPFTDSVLRNRWGSLRAALEAAGLCTSAHGRRYSDDECFENLLAVWVYYGRQPKYREMGIAPSKVGGKAYVKRFGSWNGALHAFVERAQGHVAQQDGESPLAASGTRAPKAKSVRPAPSDSRDVALGLRFRIIKRDRYRCQTCGDNPPANPECVLHVDHILPWSRGIVSQSVV